MEFMTSLIALKFALFENAIISSVLRKVIRRNVTYALRCLCRRSENWKRQYNASDPDLLGELSSLFSMMVTATAILMVVAKYEIAYSVFFSPSHFLRQRSDNKRYNSTVRNFPMHFRRCRRFIPHGYRFVVPLFSSSVSNAPRAID